jgi:serine/threonine protein kinase
MASNVLEEATVDVPRAQVILPTSSATVDIDHAEIVSPQVITPVDRFVSRARRYFGKVPGIDQTLQVAQAEVRNESTTAALEKLAAILVKHAHAQEAIRKIIGENRQLLERSVQELMSDTWHDRSSVLTIPAAPELSQKGGELYVGASFARGAFGVVCYGSNEKKERVAVKLFRPREELSPDRYQKAKRRFVSEGKTYSGLDEKCGVPRFIAAGESDNESFIAMEFIPGWTLDELVHMKYSKPFRTENACGFMALILANLHHLHRKGIFHRDLKPENIRIGLNGEVYLLDLGLKGAADHEGARETKSSDVIGTALCMAPEQINDPLHVKAPADVYAAGCIANWLLTGNPPSKGQLAQVLGWHARDDKTKFHALDIHRHPNKKLCDRVLEMLSYDPDDRCQLEESGQEFLDHCPALNRRFKTFEDLCDAPHVERTLKAIRQAKLDAHASDQAGVLVASRGQVLDALGESGDTTTELIDIVPAKAPGAKGTTHRKGLIAAFGTTVVAGIALTIGLNRQNSEDTGQPDNRPTTNNVKNGSNDRKGESKHQDAVDKPPVMEFRHVRFPVGPNGEFGIELQISDGAWIKFPFERGVQLWEKPVDGNNTGKKKKKGSFHALSKEDLQDQLGDSFNAIKSISPRKGIAAYQLFDEESGDRIVRMQNAGFLYIHGGRAFQIFSEDVQHLTYARDSEKDCDRKKFLERFNSFDIEKMGMTAATDENAFARTHFEHILKEEDFKKIVVNQQIKSDQGFSAKNIKK